MTAQLLMNASLVLPEGVEQGVDLLIEGDRIQAFNPEAAGSAQRIDLSGQWLMPGMIDLHCDALEKEIEPRPGVHFPLEFACAQADRRNASAGITTVYHALSFANQELGVRNNTFAAEIVRAVNSWQQHALIDNRVHARYEVTDETGPEALSPLLADGQLQLLSFMDHSPGQGQFRDVEAYRRYLSGTYKMDQRALDQLLAQKMAAADGALQRMQQLAAQARNAGIALASHDDDSAEKVAALRELGAAISEFPVNLETAQAARAAGLATLFGAPNILRGQSQSGNMKALDAIAAGVADCLCGDYSPAALLPAVMLLPQISDLSLAQAVALVTRNPARAAGLHDRGEIALGKRADLIAVSRVGELPQPTHVWSAGVLVLSANFHQLARQGRET